MAGGRREVVIVGASAAGLRCACRLARLRPSWLIRVIEQQRRYSYGACGLPYVLSGDIADLDELRRTAYGQLRDDDFFREHKGVEILSETRAVAVHPTEHWLWIERDSSREKIFYEDLVIATGARPRKLPGQPDHPRVLNFHTPADFPALHQGLIQGDITHAAVVGAGLLGVELAEAFRTLWGIDVTLIEAAPAPLPGVLDPEVGQLVAAQLEGQGVRLLAGAPVTGIEARESHVVVRTETEMVKADVAVVAIGVRPSVELARGAGAAVGTCGALAVDEHLATSVPHVWAVGDCVEVRDLVTGGTSYWPLGSLANRQGRVLANILAGREDRFLGAAGASAVKVFDRGAAAVGCTQTHARELGIDARAVWLSTDAQAHYWPEAGALYLKLVYDPGTRRVLGLQAYGSGVDKRVDVATPLISARATLEQFTQLEHAYAPAFAPAMEPLVVAALAAQNQEEGGEAHSPEFAAQGWSLIDVRREEERRVRPLPFPGESVSVSAIRQGEMGRGGPPWLVVCERGTRGAEVARLLFQRGQPVQYLAGGLSWQRAAGRPVHEKQTASGPEKPR